MQVEFIADARYSVTFPANSSAAVHHAVKVQNYTRVLVEPIYSPGADVNESGLFFAPVMCSEVLALRTMPVMDWLTTLSRKHHLPRIDSLDDLLEPEGLEEIWLYMSMEANHVQPFLDVLKADYPNESRIVLAAPFPLPASLDYRVADTTGKRDYFMTNGQFQDWLSGWNRWDRSVTFREDCFSRLRARPVL